MSNGTTKVTVMRSEKASEKTNEFVGLFRRFRFAIIAKQTITLPQMATITIIM